MREHIQTYSELKSTYPAVKNTNQVHKNKLSYTERLALIITNKVGSMGFFFTLAICTAIWLLWNLLAPKSLQFDPFPGFVLLLFITNVIEILLMPLIMVGQNLQGKHAEIRSEHDYETNIKAEKEVEVILQHLEQQEELLHSQHETILKLLEKIEKIESK